MPAHRLVLFAHGSSDPIWQDTFRKLVKELRAELGEQIVPLAFMERAEPTLVHVAGKAPTDRVGRMIVMPMFFSAGGHLPRDISRLLDDVRACYPELEIELLRPIGEHPSFGGLVARIADSALGGGIIYDALSTPAVDREFRKWHHNGPAFGAGESER